MTAAPQSRPLKRAATQHAYISHEGGGSVAHTKSSSLVRPQSQGSLQGTLGGCDRVSPKDAITRPSSQGGRRPSLARQGSIDSAGKMSPTFTSVPTTLRSRPSLLGSGGQDQTQLMTAWDQPHTDTMVRTVAEKTGRACKADRDGVETEGGSPLPSILAAAKGVSQFKRAGNVSAKEFRKAAVCEEAKDEVRTLGMDKPDAADVQATDGPHELLMMRLKSRGARLEAEDLRVFLLNYRACKLLDRDSENRLDRQLKATEKKAEDLRQHSEVMRLEVAEAERTLERVNNAIAHTKQAGPDPTKMLGLSNFEKQQMLIQEDKREEEVAHQRDEAQNHYSKKHRRLQSELVELRDYKVLLAEYRRVRLEKLQDNLARVKDGRKLRAIVREMIRQGGQRVLHRLETTGTPLEPWMCEVLVNCCHLEIKMEDTQRRLVPLQKEALFPLKAQVEQMVHLPKEKRFERLCTWTWDSLRDKSDGAGRGMEANPWRKTPTACRSDSPPSRKATEEEAERPRPREVDVDGMKVRHRAAADVNADNRMFGGQVCVCGSAFLQDASFCRRCGQKRPEAEQHAKGGDLVTEAPIEPKFASERPEVMAAEAEVQSLRKLLEDTRQNAAAAICNRIRQASKGSAGCNASAMEWGRQMLTLMVNEDFAKAATKELRKTQSMLTA